MRPVGSASASVAQVAPVGGGGLITRIAPVTYILLASKVGIWLYFAYSFFYLTEFCTLLQSTYLH